MAGPEGITRVEVPCVLCGAGQAEVCYRLGTFRVQRCRECGLVAINPRFPEDRAGELYEAYFSGRVRVRDQDGEKYYGDYIADSETRRSGRFHLNRVHRRRLRAIETLAPGRRLLDVGSAAGFFLLDARQRGWEVSGLELSASAVAYARKRGLRVEAGTLKDARLEPGSLDAVTMWDVVEHLHSPVRDLRHAWQGLRARGVLAMSTPNYDSVVRLVRGGRWHGFKLDEHLTLFTPQTMELLLEETGFEPVKMLTTRTDLVRARRFFQRIRGRVPHPIYEALRLGQAAVNETVGKALFLPWERLLRGDMLEVYARKP